MTRPNPSCLLAVLAATASAICIDSEAHAACQLYQTAIVAHDVGGYFARCVDSHPLASFAFALAAPDSVHTNDQDLVCEAQSGSSSLDTWCAPEAGSAGDGRVTVLYDWRLPGSVGCPVPYDPSYGDGRILLIVAASDGSSLLTSVGYAPDLGGYVVDAAEPYTGTTISPLLCGLPEGNVLRVNQMVESGGQVSADLNLLAPHIFSDCDPGTVGRVLGTCPYGLASIPAVAPGRLYWRAGSCPESGGVVNLKTDAWTLAADPDPNGHVSLSLPAPAQNQCLFLGATFTLGGIESPAIGGYVHFPAPSCRDADFDGVTDCGGDCSDMNPEAFPGHSEVCDGVDNDCDGLVDEDGVCSLTCPSPGKIGADVRVTFDGPFGSVYPSMVRSGDGYGVAWMDGRDEPVSAVYFARLDATGAKIGEDVRVSSGEALFSPPRLVWTGSEYGLVWQDYEPIDQTSGTSGIRFARLDALGQKIGEDFRLTGDAAIEPSLVWTGSEYGVAWRSDVIMLARLDASGNRLGPDIRVTLSSAEWSRAPSLVWTGSEYGLAWLQGTQGRMDVRFARLSATGARIGTETEFSRYMYAVGSPSLVWTGSGFGIAWEYESSPHKEILFARLSAMGETLTFESPLTYDSFASSQPSLVWTGAEFGLSWLDERDGNPEVYFSRIDPTGSKVGTDIRVTNDPSWTYSPTMVGNGSGYGLAWSDLRDDNSEIYFARLGCDCVDADGDGFTSCQETNDHDPTVNPAALETCDGRDNNSNGLIDDGLGVTTCGVGACARTVSACLRGVRIACTPGEPTVEVCDGLDNDCDGLVDDDANGYDTDADGVANSCDNCAMTSNPDQNDFDADGQGDFCDLDDGRIWIIRQEKALVEWQPESVYSAFNLYRGSLSALRLTREYTQDPAAVPLAARFCGVTGPSQQDSILPPRGEAVYYLVTGMGPSGESDLGQNSSGQTRPNAHPCP